MSATGVEQWLSHLAFVLLRPTLGRMANTYSVPVIPLAEYRTLLMIHECPTILR